jgi:hypothetical protein
MMEAGVVIDKAGHAAYWHAPADRTIASLPDSRSLWDFIWENRDRISGVAHSHPGSGLPSPSHTDITTFSAIEAALGRRLSWWITSSDVLVVWNWEGPNKHDYKGFFLREEPDWVGKLRELSDGSTVRN